MGRKINVIMHKQNCNHGNWASCSYIRVLLIFVHCSWNVLQQDTKTTLGAHESMRVHTSYFPFVVTMIKV